MAPVHLPYLSTTFPDFDTALGIGGLLRGRLNESVGTATFGSLTLAAKILSAARGGLGALVAWLDLQRTCHPDYLHRCGLDLERLLVVRPRRHADGLVMAQASVRIPVTWRRNEVVVLAGKQKAQDAERVCVLRLAARRVCDG